MAGVQLWDLGSVKMLQEFRGHSGPVYSVATPDPPGEKRQLVISASRDRRIKVRAAPSPAGRKLLRVSDVSSSGLLSYPKWPVRNGIKWHFGRPLAGQIVRIPFSGRLQFVMCSLWPGPGR